MTATRHERKTKGVEIMLPPDLLAKLTRMAAAHPDRSKSAVIRTLLRQAPEPKKV